jgi:hypothetical protein
MEQQHTVYLYEEDSSLMGPIADFARKGLEQKERVIIIATHQHRLNLEAILLADKLVRSETQNAHIETLDASTMLPRFLRNGWPDEGLFVDVVAQIVGSKRTDTAIHIYQEVAGVLLAGKDFLVGLQLERLWTKWAASRNRSVLCGYPASAFQTVDREYFLNQICVCHSTHIGKDKCSDKAA